MAGARGRGTGSDLEVVRARCYLLIFDSPGVGGVAPSMAVVVAVDG